jgi:hypothetical protein
LIGVTIICEARLKKTSMTTLTARQKLISYLADADETKVNALFTLLESDIQEDNSFSLTDEQLVILENERHLHISGQSKSYSRQEAADIIRGKRSL